MELWLNFIIILFIQFLFFLFVYYKIKSKIQILSFIKLLLLGIPFGFVFDLVVGKYFGIFNYYLGFNIIFIIINGLFSYGIALATIELLKKEKPVKLYLWILLLAGTYEITNYFFPVWLWKFTNNLILNEIIVVLVLYAELSCLMIMYLNFINTLYKKYIA